MLCITLTKFHIRHDFNVTNDMARSCFYGVLFLLGLSITSCKERKVMTFDEPVSTKYEIDSSDIIDTNITIVALPDPTIYEVGQEIKTGAIVPDSLVAFGKSLVGTPYLYASSDPANGFDC